MTAEYDSCYASEAIHAPGLIPSIPIAFLGTVSAGEPLEPVEGDDLIRVPAFLLRNGQNFALKVRGDSMVGDGVRDGDILVIRRQRSAKQGQTVVAVLNGEATLKRIYRTEGRVELRPANPAMKSIFLDESTGSFEIRGVVVGLIRQFESVLLLASDDLERAREFGEAAEP
jgi:repressor LexA